MRVSIIIPTYNEKENISIIVPEVFSVSPNVDVFVVDDNSPDGTATIVEMMIRTYPNLHLINRKEKNGLGEAYKYAISLIMKEGGIDAIITMDADGSHDTKYLPAMIDALETHDLVIGSRYVKGGGVENWEKWRFALSKYGNLYARAWTWLPARDLTAGFVGIRREIVEKMNFEEFSASGYAYQIEFKFRAVRAGASILEVPIIFKERREGESKMSSHIVREGLIMPIRLCLSRLIR